MKYKITARNNFHDSLLFWLQKFLYRNCVKSNSRYINNNLSYQVNIKKLSIEDLFINIEELELLLKEFRTLGNKTISSYSYPCIKLFKYLVSLNLNSMFDITEQIIIHYLYQLNFNSSVTKDNHKNMIILFFSFIDDNNSDFNDYTHNYNIKLLSFKNNKISKIIMSSLVKTT